MNKKCERCVKIKNIEDFISKINSKENKICNNCNDQILIKKEKNKNGGTHCSCKNLLISNKKTCEECLSKIKSRNQTKRDAAKLNGLCIGCYKNNVELDYSKCKTCRSRDKLSIQTKLFRGARSRAKKSNLEFTIKESDIIIPKFCPILKLELKENIKKSKKDSFSLDRIDNNKGYIPGNIHVISHRANQIKNDASLNEIELIYLYLKNIS